MSSGFVVGISWLDMFKDVGPRKPLAGKTSVSEDVDC
jgi:hypothetical protein